MKRSKRKLSRAERKAERKRIKANRKEYRLTEPLSRKDYLIIVFCVICLAATVVLFKVSGNEKPQTEQTAANSAVINSNVTQPATQTITQPVTQNNENTESTTAVSTPDEETADELQEAITAACAAVNKMKHSDNFSATKDQEIKLELTECSIPGMTKLANPILERYGKRRVIDFNFENGIGYDETHKEDVTAADAIPPTGKDFALDKNGIASYEIAKNGDNTRYVFKLKEENSTLDNPVPTYHAMAMDYLDMAGIDIAPAQITQADFYYSGATVTVEVDQNGNLTYFEEYMPVKGTGAGKLGLSASGTMDGYIDEIWTFK